MNQDTEQRLIALRDKRQKVIEQINDLNSAKSSIDQQIIDLLEDNNVKSYTEGNLSTSTARRSKVFYDWQGIQSIIGPVTWNKITVKQPDPERLTTAMFDGTIDPEAVEKVSELITVKRGEPYVIVRKSNE